MTLRFVQATVMTNWNGETGYMATTRDGRSGLQKISGITSTIPFPVSLTPAPLFYNAVKIMLVKECAAKTTEHLRLYRTFYI